MNANNQTSASVQSGEATPVKMVPVSSSITPHGASVSYGIQGYSSNIGSTSGFGNQMAWGVNSPSVSASQFNLLNSGNFNTNYGSSGVQNFSNISGTSRRTVAVQPSVDISETSSDIVVTAFVTNGVTNDLSLNVKEDSLTISGSVWTGTDTCFICRTVPLTTTVRAEAVDASFHSGVLEIRLPKTEKK